MTELTPDEFETASQLLGQPSSRREEYLSAACGADREKRQRIERYLQDQHLPDHHERDRSLQPTLPDVSNETCDPPLIEKPGTRIGPYQLLQQLGEGGMGVVYMAQQHSPIKRRVAVKLIKPGMDSRQVIARFEAERQSLAIMDHPNIAKVLDGGATQSGHPYFVMELVNGLPITKYCDEQHLTLRERLELFILVCQGVQHAHQKGIIHRDLKPGNLLVALCDGQAVPKIIDFGVAKAISQTLTDKTMFTRLGQVVGTLEYMSPEQAGYNQLDIDTRSDVYSLGVVLYELLTGLTPFDSSRLRSAAIDERLKIIREEDPPKPSTKLSGSNALPSIAANRRVEPEKLRAMVRGELDWIVMKAMEKDRARRYESASKLAEDLRHFLEDEPVLACPPSTGYHVRKFIRRNQRTLISGAVLALSVLVGAGAIGWVVRDRRVAAETLANERAVQQAAIEREVDLALQEAKRWQTQGKWTDALSAAKRAQGLLTVNGNKELRERVDRTHSDIAMVLRLENIRAQGSAILEVKSMLIRSDHDYTIAFRDFGIDLDTLEPADAAERIKSRPDVTTALVVAIGDWAFVRRERDRVSAKRILAVAQAVDPDPWRQQVRLALANNDWESLAQLANSDEILTQPAATLYLLSLALHDRSGGRGSELGLELMRHAQRQYPSDYWVNYRLGQWLIWMGPEHAAEGIGFMRAAIAIRPWYESYFQLGMGLANLSRSDEALSAYWKVLEFEGVGTPNLHRRMERLLLESGDREDAIRRSREHGSAGRNLLAWLLATSPNPAFRDPALAVELAEEAVEGSPNTADYHCTLGVARFRKADWKGAAEAFERSQALRALTPVVDSFFAGDTVDRFFLAMTHWHLGDREGARNLFVEAAQSMARKEPSHEELRRFRAEAESLLGVQDHRLFRGHSDEVRSVAISGSEVEALSASADRTIRRWDLASGVEIACWHGHADAVFAVEYSPDDRRAVTGSHDDTARLWDVDSGEELMQFQHAADVWSVAFSPDGRRVLTGSEHSLHLWDCESGKELRKFEGHVGHVRSVAFSRDGLWAFSAGHDTTVRQWEVTSGKEIRRFQGHIDLVLSVAVSPDGRLALSGGCDQRMRLWDIETGEQKRVFEGHYGNLEAVDFAFESRYVVSASADGSIRFWELATGDVLESIGTSEVLDLAISNHGQYLLSANKDHAVRCWSLPTLHLQLKSPMTADASSP